MIDRITSKVRTLGYLKPASSQAPYLMKGVCRSVAAFGILVLGCETSALAQADAVNRQEPSGLLAPTGTTALSGRVVDFLGNALANVRVVDNASTAFTDSAGRFLLSPVVSGTSVVQIDARHVGGGPGLDYGFYELKAFAPAGETTAMGFKSWLTPISHSQDVEISSPNATEIVVKNNAIPGLELRIPAGTVIRDVDGQVVTHIGITALPPDRQPYPMPSGISLPYGYTIQPGGACLYSANGGVGYARLIYPNVYHHLPRAREFFWDYEPDRQGWRQYGAGQVSSNGTQIVPDRDTVITDFYSAECDPKTRSHPLLISRPISTRGVAP